MKIIYTILVILVFNTIVVSMAHSAETTSPDPDRVKAFEKMLPGAPRGVGSPISNRKAWEELAKRTTAQIVIKEAEKLLKTPTPDLTDDLYLDFSRTGNRKRYEQVLAKRHERYGILALAECLENRGRFLPGIEAAITAVCSDKTWVYPAHDASLRNFKGEEIEIDLNSASVSWNLAAIDYWLAEKLSPAIRKLIADELERRTFTPFTKMVNTGKPRMWWLTTMNNWNAVCLADVTGTALTMIESRSRRAFFAASAEKYIQYFLKGFTPDGYCSEGISYWNYGFGHFVMLAEVLRQSTEGKVDMLSDARVKSIALYAWRMEILPKIYPTFADGPVGSQPDPKLMGFLSRRFGLGWTDFEKDSFESYLMRTGRLFELSIFGFQNLPTPSETSGSNGSNRQHPLRDFFSDAGILICRPKSDQAHALGVALKGGHNAENHNHNDVGSFVVALSNSTPLLDPGSEVYTARTFSSDRYISNVLNSYGHSVPRVAGTLQITGRTAQAKILKAQFTDAADTYVMDISSAYKVDGLKKLERTFIFSRDGQGQLMVTDTVEFDRPQAFGTALITFSKWKKTAPDRLRIGEGNDAVEATITTTGGDIHIDAEELKEELPGKQTPIRLGIDFKDPVKNASVTVTIKAADEI
jgi:hypothetical protein